MSDETVRNLKESIIEELGLHEGHDFVDHSHCDPDDCHSGDNVNILKPGWLTIEEEISKGDEDGC